jgi:hypothetical protein
MPKLDLNGPFDLKDAVIDTKINANAIGNFTIGFMNDSGKFVVKVIGRSDRDLQGDLKSARRRYSGGMLSKTLGRSSLDKFKFSLADTAQSVHQVE